MVKALSLFLTCTALLLAEDEFRNLEFSFGTSQMFVGQNSVDRFWEEEKAVLPTSGALIAGEYRFDSTWSVMAFYNLPLGLDRIVEDDGTIVEEYASPSAGLGPNLSLFPLTFRETRFTTQWSAGPIVVFSPGNFGYSLTSALRLHLATEEGFTMYLGAAGTLGIPGVVLWYGVGHQF